MSAASTVPSPLKIGEAVVGRVDLDVEQRKLREAGGRAAEHLGDVIDPPVAVEIAHQDAVVRAHPAGALAPCVVHNLPLCACAPTYVECTSLSTGLSAVVEQPVQRIIDCDSLDSFHAAQSPPTRQVANRDESCGIFAAPIFHLDFLSLHAHSAHRSRVYDQLPSTAGNARRSKVGYAEWRATRL
ncbi:MAG: hypothetical protein WCE79_15100 [Xanthobacteraceae bacterium]